MNLLFKTMLLLAIPCCLFAKSINVYLRFDDPILTQQVARFNAYLDESGILARYQIEPFLNNHPLHLTLFLASYPDNREEDIKHKVALIAQHWPAIQVKTAGIYLGAGNFVMLDVGMEKQLDGQNQLIQQLADEVTLSLTNLRDFNAKIPAWVDAIPGKKKAFLSYGSPNVFFEFAPHFSVLAKSFANSEDQARFQNEMNPLLQEYSFADLTTQSAVIGVGYVDSFGQVIEEIAVYKLGE